MLYRIVSRLLAGPFACASAARLSVPERLDAAEGSFDIRSRNLKHWVANLPLAHTGESARLIFKVLWQTNRTKLSAGQRWGFLEQIRSPTQHVAESLKRHYTRIGVPLPERNQKIVELAQALQGEVAIGYKILITDMVCGAARPSMNMLRASVHRTIRALSRVLIVSYQTYTQPPPGTWAELHELYRCAEQWKLLGRPVTDNEYFLPQESSIASVYKQCLMLALADPYRLAQGDIEKVYSALEKWVRAVELRPMSDLRAPRMFQVNLDRDEPPGAFDLARGTLDACRLVDTTELQALLREQVPPTASSGSPSLPVVEGEPPGFLPDATVQYLSRCWSAAPSPRRPPVAAAETAVEIVVGLRSIHYYASRLAAPEAPSASSPGAEPATAPPASEAVETDSAAAAWALPGTAQAQRAMYSGLVACDNSKECHLSWTLAAPSAVKRIGELLGVRAHDGVEQAPWKLGVLRWMKQTRGQFECGIQWLAPACIPAFAAPRAGTTDDPDERLPVLILPGQQGTADPSLIAPPLYFHPGDTVTLYIRGQERRVQLVQSLDLTAGYGQFQAKPLADTQATDDADGSGIGARHARAFDELWATLY